jgi:hypothetical protein
MKTGLPESALLVSLTIVGLSGCKTPQFCEPLGACGGDLLAGATDFAKQDGLPDRSWTVVGPGACQDRIQTPPATISLARQPPPFANQRPPDNATADWCGNLVLKSNGEVKEFIPYTPPVPLKVAELTVSADFDFAMNPMAATKRGTYVLQTTVGEPRTFVLSESCITAQGLRLSCPALGRQLGEFLHPEANFYNMRCQDPADPNQGGCVCQFDLTFIGGQNGRWAIQEGGKQIEFFENTSYAPAALVDYCFNPDPNALTLDLTGTNETPLFNAKGLRTMHMVKPSCNDGVQSVELGEQGIDCGGQCAPCGTCLPGDIGPDGKPAAGCTCRNGVHDANEVGIDCGGACFQFLCDPDPSITDDKLRHRSCQNGKQDPWEEGKDCGGNCRDDVADLPVLCP